jgi:kynurenine formamidase
LISVSYRLSPYPERETNPSTPEQADRNVQHPAHLNDLISALRYSQREYNFGSNYVFVGHSCGATLAFQALDLLKANNEPAPMGIIGVAGLYDLPKLIKLPEIGWFYKLLISNAFGDNEAVWKDQSPVDKHYDYSIWTEGQIVILARCKEDEYVPVDELEDMEKRLDNNGKKVTSIVIDGSHDACWEQGQGLVDCIQEMFKSLGYT